MTEVNCLNLKNPNTSQFLLKLNIKERNTWFSWNSSCIERQTLSLQCLFDIVCHSLAFGGVRGACSAEVEVFELGPKKRERSRVVWNLDDVPSVFQTIILKCRISTTHWSQRQKWPKWNETVIRTKGLREAHLIKEEMRHGSDTSDTYLLIT